MTKETNKNSKEGTKLKLILSLLEFCLKDKIKNYKRAIEKNMKLNIEGLNRKTLYIYIYIYWKIKLKINKTLIKTKMIKIKTKIMNPETPTTMRGFEGTREKWKKIDNWW